MVMGWDRKDGWAEYYGLVWFGWIWEHGWLEMGWTAFWMGALGFG
jgi:hypothetical protein